LKDAFPNWSAINSTFLVCPAGMDGRKWAPLSLLVATTQSLSVDLISSSSRYNAALQRADPVISSDRLTKFEQ